MAPELQSFVIPLLVTSSVDIGRLLRELEAIDNGLSQARLRKTGAEAQLPRLTSLMQQMVDANKLNLLEESHRQQLAAFLQTAKATAPVLHISFGSDPSTAFIERLISWLRQEIHPLILLTIGLQPNIGAGCIVRTTNKYFDFSLRQDFASKRSMLLERLGPVLAAPVAVAAAPEAARTPAPHAKAVHAAPQPAAQAAPAPVPQVEREKVAA
jgi:hypothetical protein